VVATRTLSEVDARDCVLLSAAPWCASRLDFRKRNVHWRLRRIVQIIYAVSFKRLRIAGLAERGLSPFTTPLIRAATRIPADLYVAHQPAALPAAAIAARRHRGVYAFDAEDFHLGECPADDRYDDHRRLIRAAEERYLPGCAYITAASPGIADAYVEAYGIERPTVLLNVFPRAEAPTAPTPFGQAAPRPSAYWFSQTIGPDRGIECALRAIALAKTRPHLHLRGSPAAGFLDHLTTIARSIGVTDRLHISSPAAPPKMASLAAMHDVGLSCEPGHSANNKIALGNKLFTYLLAGLPVVLSDIPAHRHIAPHLGIAARLYPADDAAGLARGLDIFFENPTMLAAARTKAFQIGQSRFNWDVEQIKLLKHLNPHARHYS